ncbi:tRNA synthetases class I (E and Q), catalytic domain protein, partial [Chlamydia psittaci 84-8471/1]
SLKKKILKIKSSSFKTFRLTSTHCLDFTQQNYMFCG